METRYCIMCGHEVPVTDTQDGNIHTYTIFSRPSLFPISGTDYDIIVCDGPFTTSPPPELPEMEIVEIPEWEYELSNIMGLLVLESL